MAMNNRLFRPRASGGFSPKQIAGLSVWLDAADSATVTLNGSTVSEWRDKSGNSVNVTQSTAARQPTYSSAAINGQNALTFDSNDWLVTSGLSLPTTNQTIFAVFRENGEVGNAGYWVLTPASGNDYTSSDSVFAEASGGATLIGYMNIPALDESGSGNVPLSVCTANLAAVSSTVRRNGADKGTANHGRSGSSSGLLIGARYLDGAPNIFYAANMTFCEFIRYSSSLGASQVSSVEKYLAKKWGITLA